MITSIRIDDNKRTPFKYTSKIKAFKNGSEFIFKPGVNVIVGKNGSGKSTLLNMISKYMLCEKKMCSELPSEALYFPDIFDDDKVLDGISIKSDYIGKVFHLLQQTEMRKDDILDNINNLSLYMNRTSRSSGEKNLHAMNSLFDFVFNQDEYAFPKDSPVDLGIWQRVDPKDLIIPLDVHVHNVALELGLISRKRADMKAAMEVTEAMRQIFPDDPARGDFALFGYGIERIKD